MSTFESCRLDESSQAFVHPLKAFGEIWDRGWSIPTPWAIDANDQCWMGGGHGEALHPCTAERILTDMDNNEQEDEANDVRKILGLGVKRPSWMTSALNAGWEPPNSWMDPEDPNDSRHLQVQGGHNLPCLGARGMKRAMELARRTLQTTPGSTREIVLVSEHDDAKLLVTLLREHRALRRGQTCPDIKVIWETDDLDDED